MLRLVKRERDKTRKWMDVTVRFSFHQHALAFCQVVSVGH